MSKSVVIDLALSMASQPPISFTSPTSAISITQREEMESAIIVVVSQPGLPNPTIEKIILLGEYGLATCLMGQAGGLVTLIDR